VKAEACVKEIQLFRSHYAYFGYFTQFRARQTRDGESRDGRSISVRGVFLDFWTIENRIQYTVSEVTE